mgnify:CR=1 FL=1
MMTGDGEKAARTACQQLGITEYYARVLPEDKAAKVEEIKAQGRTVIMVGDGINDSPALSAANVSVANEGCLRLSQRSGRYCSALRGTVGAGDTASLKSGAHGTHLQKLQGNHWI